MFSTKTKLQKLSEKSKSILDVFTKTQNSLREVNAEIIEETIHLKDEVNKMLATITSLEDVQIKNDVIINNIDSIFTPISPKI